MRHIMNMLLMATMGISIGCHGGESDIDKLIEDSRAKRLIGESDLVKKPLEANDIPRARSYIEKNPDYSSYHLLIALRRHHSKEFMKIPVAIKAQVLCSTLENARWLNDWSVLHPSGSEDFESAKALLEIGKGSLHFLVPFLDNARWAALEGSEEATISILYKYRRKDFAYRYVSQILGQAPTFHADPKARDKDIEALKAKLKNDAK